MPQSFWVYRVGGASSIGETPRLVWQAVLEIFTVEVKRTGMDIFSTREGERESAF